MDKRGLTKVVTTLILILVGIIIAGILWSILDKNLDEVSEQIILDSMTIDLKITHVQIVNETDIKITIKRVVGDGDVTGVAFVLFDEDDSEVVERNITMKELEVKNFEVTLQVVDAYEVHKVSIAPLYVIRRNKEKIGMIQDEIILNSYEEGPVWINTEEEEEESS